MVLPSPFHIHPLQQPAQNFGDLGLSGDILNSLPHSPSLGVAAPTLGIQTTDTEEIAADSQFPLQTRPMRAAASTSSSDISVFHRRANAVSLSSIHSTTSSLNSNLAEHAIEQDQNGIHRDMLLDSSRTSVAGRVLANRGLYLLRPPRALQPQSGESNPNCQPCLQAVHKDHSSLVEQGECAICLEEFRCGDTVQPMMQCQHFFHQACSYEFLETHCRTQPNFWMLEQCISCPLCRRRFLATDMNEVPESEQDSAVLVDAVNARMLDYGDMLSDAGHPVWRMHSL